MLLLSETYFKLEDKGFRQIFWRKLWFIENGYKSRLSLFPYINATYFWVFQEVFPAYEKSDLI